MEMLLMVVAMSLLGVAVSGLLFAAATHEAPGTAEVSAESARPAPSVFFTEDRTGAARPCRSRSCCCRLRATCGWSRPPSSRSWRCRPPNPCTRPTQSPLVH